MILGIDPSLTATGLCRICQSGKLESMATIRRNLDGLPRLRWLAGAVGDMSTPPVAFAVMEGISMGSHGMMDQLAGLHWMIRDRLPESLPVLIVAPSQLKKFVLGTGKGDKSLMLREVFKRWNINANNDNEADAAGLAMIGRAYLNPALCETQAQHDVIAALKSPKVKKARKR